MRCCSMVPLAVARNGCYRQAAVALGWRRDHLNWSPGCSGSGLCRSIRGNFDVSPRPRDCPSSKCQFYSLWMLLPGCPCLRLIQSALLNLCAVAPPSVFPSGSGGAWATIFRVSRLRPTCCCVTSVWDVASGLTSAFTYSIQILYLYFLKHSPIVSKAFLFLPTTNV